MKNTKTHILRLEAVVSGGQCIGTLDDGRRAFVWGGLPDERVTIRETKRKSKFVEGVVTEIHEASKYRVSPRDPDSYLSTSPWQIMSFELEQRSKAALILEAFQLHDVQLPGTIDVYSNGVEYGYRNKVEFSWYGSSTSGAGDQPVSKDKTTEEHETLDLAFFRRGTKGKIPIDTMSLIPDAMMDLARTIRDYLTSRNVTARELKSLLIRCDQEGNCVWQLYVKDADFNAVDERAARSFEAQGGEVIFSDPRSPASRITKRLATFGETVLSDSIHGVPFRYATEGFFQVNIPVYEQALGDMSEWLPPKNGDMASEQSNGQQRVSEVVDLYSGVGSIGLTIGGPDCTLIEIDENAVREMKRNIAALQSSAKAILAPAEKALDHISRAATIIVDPPRAGLHQDVITKLLETKPPRIIYLSCNPVTQARDVSLLTEKYHIVYHRGYNFFPRTPHIEHLVVLDAT